jgi:hypothetical protein
MKAACNFFLLMAILLGWSCQKMDVLNEGEDKDETDVFVDAPLTSLDGTLADTSWELAGIVNAKTGAMTALKQQGDDKTYFRLIFIEQVNNHLWCHIVSNVNTMGVIGIIDNNSYRLDLGNLLNYEYFEESPKWTLFLNACFGVQYFSWTENELKLYFNNKKEFLLFKSGGREECVNRIEINENEYVMSQITPEEVFDNSNNKWIIKNHSNRKVTLGSIFLIEYFDGSEWTAFRRFSIVV